MDIFGFPIRATTKKDETGFPKERLHMRDAEGDKLLITVDSEYEFGAAIIPTEDFNFIVLTPDLLRLIADWVEEATAKENEFADSPAGIAWLDKTCGEDGKHSDE